jgi:hypothetical protein
VSYLTSRRYLVLKMSSPNGVLKICRDRNVGASALKKLQALASQHEAATRPRGQDQEPSSLRHHGRSSALHVQPSSSEDIPVKTIQIGTDAA